MGHKPDSVKAQRKQLDWEKIEVEYRAGVLSLRELAKKYGCVEGAIRRRAKAYGWDRDLSARIEQAVRTKIVRTSVRTEADKATDREIVEANAEAILRVRMEHRSDIQVAKGRVSDLFARLERRDGGAEELSFKDEVDCTRKLVDAARVVISMEREAWDIESDKGEDKGERFVLQITPQEAVI